MTNTIKWAVVLLLLVLALGLSSLIVNMKTEAFNKGKSYTIEKINTGAENELDTQRKIGIEISNDVSNLDNDELNSRVRELVEGEDSSETNMFPATGGSENDKGGWEVSTENESGNEGEPIEEPTWFEEVSEPVCETIVWDAVEGWIPEYPEGCVIENDK